MKKALLITGGIILILTLTNPSVSAFRDYLGTRTTHGLRRKYNFIVCSYYYNGDNYFAIADNFFKISQPNIYDEQRATDSIRMDDSIKHADSGKMKAAISLMYDTIGNSRETLYAKLISDGYTEQNLGNEELFIRKVQDSTNAKKLYFSLLKEGYTERQLGTNSKFLYYMTLR